MARASAQVEALARAHGLSVTEPPRAPERISRFPLELQAKAEFTPASRALSALHAPRSVSVDPGTISWHEFHCAQPTATAQLLSELIDGEVLTRSRGDASEYTTVMSHGCHIAGGVALDRNELPHWDTYLRVPNVDLICDLALALGGSVAREPFGILGLDRRAVISDPTGALLTVISGGDDRRTVGSGALGWDELRSIDPRASARFWCSLFDWTAAPLPMQRDSRASVFMSGGRAVASVEQATASEKISRWLPIATVHRENFNAALARAIRLGATMRVPPSAHAVLGNIAIMVDRCGVELALGVEPSARLAAA